MYLPVPTRLDDAELGLLATYGKDQIVCDLTGDAGAAIALALAGKRTCTTVRQDRAGPFLAALKRHKLEVVSNHQSLGDHDLSRLTDNWRATDDRQTRHRGKAETHYVCVHIGEPIDTLIESAEQVYSIVVTDEADEYLLPLIRTRLRPGGRVICLDPSPSLVEAFGWRIREWINSLAVLAVLEPSPLPIY